MKNKNNITRLSLSAIMVFLVLFMINPFALSVSASYNYWDSDSIPTSRQKPRLYDDAGLLTNAQEKEINEKLDSLSAKHKCNVAILTVEYHDDDIQNFSDDYFDYNGFQADYNGNGVLFVISMSDRDAAISTCGNCIQAFTDYGQDKLFDKMMDDLGDNDFYSAFLTYISVSDDYLTMYEKGSPYDVGSKTTSEIIGYVVLSFFAALIVAIFPILFMKAQLGTVKMRTDASGYQTHDGLHMLIHRDTYLTSNVVKTRIQSDNNSGSHSSSHRSGGSHTHVSHSGTVHGGSHRHF